MEWTKEQKDIINSTGNIKINAVAGSGKTTTVIEYAKTRPATSKILYLAFNRSVKLEAAKKFAEKKLYNCLSPLKCWTKIVKQFSHSKFRQNGKIKKTIYS